MAVGPSRQKLNAMVNPSQIQTFLCFTCGDMFSNNPDYTRHMLEHQAVSLCCQLYYLEYQDKKQHSKKRESGDWQDQADAQSPTPPAEALHGRRNTAPSMSDRRMSGEILGRNQRILSQDEGQRKKRGRKPKKILESLDDVGTQSKKQRRESVEEVEMPAKKEMRESLEENEPQVKRLKLTASEYTLNETKLPFEEDSGYLELVEHPSSCSACSNSPIFNFPLLTLGHYISEHGSQIVRVYLQFFSGSQLVFTKTSNPGKDCSLCELIFEDDTRFHIHLLESHLASVTRMVMKRRNLEKISKIEVVIHHQPTGRSDFLTLTFEALLHTSE